MDQVAFAAHQFHHTVGLKLTIRYHNNKLSCGILYVSYSFDLSDAQLGRSLIHKLTPMLIRYS